MRPDRRRRPGAGIHAIRNEAGHPRGIMIRTGARRKTSTRARNIARRKVSIAAGNRISLKDGTIANTPADSTARAGARGQTAAAAGKRTRQQQKEFSSVRDAIISPWRRGKLSFGNCGTTRKLKDIRSLLTPFPG